MASFEKSSTIIKSPSTASASDPIPGKLRMLCALYENMSEFVLPLCNAVPDRPHPETPVTTTSHIVDISNVGLMQFWNLKGHMQAASTLASAHYPETLDRVFVCPPPRFVSSCTDRAPPDPRRAVVLPDCVGLDQALV